MAPLEATLPPRSPGVVTMKRRASVSGETCASLTTAVMQWSWRIHWATSPDSQVLDSTPTYLESLGQALVVSPIPRQSCQFRPQATLLLGSRGVMRVTRVSSLLPRGLIMAEGGQEAVDVAEVGA